MNPARWLALLALALSAGLSGNTRDAAAMQAGGQESSGSSTDWPMFNKDYNGRRFSTLADLNPTNARSLNEVCRVQIKPLGALQAGPVVIDGTIYLSAENRTMAIGAQDCAVRWTSDYRPEQPQSVSTNRGVAVANGKLYRGTGDARLLALDAATGRTIWKDVVGNPDTGECISGAPIVWNGLVIVGIAGSDLGVRGRIMAFDAETGREVWRFNTIPKDNEPGAETWKIPAGIRHGGGGGGTWSSFALDPATAELFVPVGNPEPAYAPAYRPGDNLYTNSMLVLDARTGALRWWYQLSPNDGRDLDLAAAPMLYYDSAGRSVVAFAGKNGYLHAVDRQTHQLLFRTAVTTIENEGKLPTAEGVHFCPGIVGGTEWNGPALDPERKLIFVGAVDWCSTIKTEPPNYHVADVNWGGSWVSDAHQSGWITAIDQDTGAVKWRFETGSPFMAALTPTAGGVLLTGTASGDFLVIDSATGAVLRTIKAGGGLAGGVVTYQIGGRQFVAFDTGNLARASMLGSVGSPTLVILRLDAALAAAQGNAANGKALYAAVCATCHGAGGRGVPGHSLDDVQGRLDFAHIVAKIKAPVAPMPKLYPGQLGETDVTDLARYLQAGMARN
jgi:alcohol dehydrogenase (cytochrome c)